MQRNLINVLPPPSVSRVGRLFLGRVVRTRTIGVNDEPCVHVRVPAHVFNKFLHMHFQQSTDHWALDRKGQAQLGDMVLIRGTEWRRSRDICHEVDRIVYRFGHLVDPITDRTGKAIGETFDAFGEEYDLRSKVINQKLGKPDYHVKTAVEEETDDKKDKGDDYSVA